MRNLTKLALGLALSSVMAFSASAEIIDSDWLTEGDGLTFTDTEQGIEFLDLTETLDMSIRDVENLLDTTYSGWAFATSDQVVTMLTNLFADTEVQYSTAFTATTYTGISEREDILNTVGGTTQGGSILIQGIVDGDTVYNYGVLLSSGQSTSYHSYNYNWIAISTSSPNFGVWLVRDSSATSSLTDVPAPLALSGLALLGLGLTRRKHAKKDF